MRTHPRPLTILTVALSVVATGCILPACGGDDSEGGGEAGGGGDAEPITVGAVIAKTGVMSQYDLPAMETVAFAIEDINADGGIDGRQLKLVERDYKSDRSLAPTVAREVIESGADVLIATCDFDFASPAALVAQEDNVASFSLCAGSPRFGPKGGLPLGFSAGVVSQASAAATAEWAYQKQKWRSAYQLVDPTLRVDIDWSNGFKDRWAQLGGKLVGSGGFQNDDPSISPQISDIRGVADQIDFINIVSYPPGGAAAIRQIRGAGIDLPIVLNDAMDGTGWFESVPDLSNTYVVDHASFFGDDPNETVNELTKRYRQATGEAPPSSLFIDGYVAVEMLAKAIEDAGSTDGDGMAEALASGDQVDTVLGPTTFSADVHTSMDRPLTITKIEGGEASFFARVTPQEVPEIVLK